MEVYPYHILHTSPSLDCGSPRVGRQTEKDAERAGGASPDTLPSPSSARLTRTSSSNSRLYYSSSSPLPPLTDPPTRPPAFHQLIAKPVHNGVVSQDTSNHHVAMDSADTKSSALTDKNARVADESRVSNEVDGGYPSVSAPDSASSQASFPSFSQTPEPPVPNNSSPYTPNNATLSAVIQPDLDYSPSTPTSSSHTSSSEPVRAEPFKRDTSPLLGHREAEAVGEVTTAGEEPQKLPALVVRVSILSTAKENVRESMSPEEKEMKKARRVKWRDNYGDSLTVVKEFER